MKKNSWIVRGAVAGLSAGFAFAWIGCDTAGAAEKESSTRVASPSTDGLKYREADKVEKVWIAEGFDFAGYDTILVEPIQSDAKPKDEKESDQLALAVRSIQRNLVDALEIKAIVPNVVTSEKDLKPGAKALKLQTTIIEFHRGSGAATRIFIGAYGGGRASIVARGILKDTAADKQFVVFEDKSKGDWGGGGSGSGNEASQKMSFEWASILNKLAKHEPIKWKD